MQIARELTGQAYDAEATRIGDPAVTVQRILRRRAESYKYFYRGNEGGSRQYSNWDVPHIAGRYQTLWEGLQLNYIGPSISYRRKHFNPNTLSTIEGDFRLILACSNFYGRLDTLNGSPGSIVAKQHMKPVRHPIKRCPSRFTSSCTVVPLTLDDDPIPILESTPQKQRPPTEVTPGYFPESLRRGELLCTDQGTILWAKVVELASIELMFYLATEKEFAWDNLEDEMQQYGAPLPESIHPMELADMTPRNMRNANGNIADVRLDLIEHFGGYFTPGDDELLYDWSVLPMTYLCIGHTATLTRQQSEPKQQR